MSNEKIMVRPMVREIRYIVETSTWFHRTIKVNVFYAPKSVHTLMQFTLILVNLHIYYWQIIGSWQQVRVLY